MAAIFTRNRFIGWASLVFSVQNWLGESEETTKTSTTPGYFTIGMSCKLERLPRLSNPTRPSDLPPCSPSKLAPLSFCFYEFTLASHHH